ncbi:Putative uncharacterized protein [Moritella viscosa]|nr:Putative uncharacterized protein [Moritella viscosa]SHO21433.1 Putative uncharacterized protein [Moritella viscosa]
MTKFQHGTSTPKSTHTQNATHAEPLLNSLLGVFTKIATIS